MGMFPIRSAAFVGTLKLVMLRGRGGQSPIWRSVTNRLSRGMQALMMLRCIMILDKYYVSKPCVNKWDEGTNSLQMLGFTFSPKGAVKR